MTNFTIAGEKMETVKRITITIPKKDYDIIQEKYIKDGIFINIQDYIRDLIKKDLRERNIQLLSMQMKNLQKI